MPRRVAAVRPRERHIDFVNDYLIPWYFGSHKDEYGRKPCDGEMRFQSEKGNIFIFHFHLDRMKCYLDNVCHWFCVNENRDASDEKVEFMAQNVLKDLTSKLHQHNPATGRELLFLVYSRRCVIRKPIDVNDLLNFFFSVGLHDLKDMIFNNGLHSKKPEVSFPVICTFHSALLDYRLPEKFRLGLHFYEETYYHIDEANTYNNSSSLLKYSNLGTYYEEEEETTSEFLSNYYFGSRARVFTVRSPGSVKSFKGFFRYLTDITLYSHEPFKIQRPVRKNYYRDDSESERDEDLREVVQGQTSNLSLHMLDHFRLQILSNDHNAIQQAVSIATSQWDKVTYSFTVDDPEIFFDMSCRQPYFTIYPESINALLRFMRAYVEVGTAWRFGLEIMRPTNKIMERILAAVKTVGFYSLYCCFYVVQSDKESMLEVVEKLADESENPCRPEGRLLTVLEVPDLKYLRRTGK